MAVIPKIRDDCHLVLLGLNYGFVSSYNEPRSVLAVICSRFGQGYRDIFTYKKARLVIILEAS